MELTPLDPVSGEPAISHIRAAFARRMHVVTANKGPIAHAYAALRDEAERAGVLFRFESTCMDGAPVYNMIRATLPGVRGAGLHRRVELDHQGGGRSHARGPACRTGIEAARRLGITEADAAYDIDGWDSAAKHDPIRNSGQGLEFRSQDQGFGSGLMASKRNVPSMNRRGFLAGTSACVGGLLAGSAARFGQTETPYGNNLNSCPVVGPEGQVMVPHKLEPTPADAARAVGRRRGTDGRAGRPALHPGPKELALKGRGATSSRS